jgi:hypothetical protein
MHHPAKILRIRFQKSLPSLIPDLRQLLVNPLNG